MKKLFAAPASLIAFGLILAMFPSPVRAAIAEWDTDFDTDGLVISDSAGENDYGMGVEYQDDGKILVLSDVQEADTTNNVQIARYLPDGTLDPDFGGTGIVILGEGDAMNQYAGAIATQYDGRILVAGDSNSWMTVWRLNEDGTPDVTFATNGVFTADNDQGSSGWDMYYNFYTDDIYVTGYSNVLGTAEMTTWKLTPEGVLDESFGSVGYILDDADQDENIYGARIELTPWDDVLVGGYFDDGLGGYLPVVWRFLSDGSRDVAFNTTGFNMIAATGKLTGLAALGDSGATVMVSDSLGGEPPAYASVLCKLDEYGVVDITFGTAGWVTLEEDFFGMDLEPGPGYEYFVSGYTQVGGDTLIDLYQYDHNGDIVAGFGTEGLLRADFPDLYLGYPADLLLTNLGYILQVGATRDQVNADDEIAVLVYKYAYQIENLPANLVAEDYYEHNVELGSNFGLFGPNLVILFTDDGYPLAVTVANFDNDLNWVDVSGDVDWDLRKSVVDGLDLDLPQQWRYTPPGGNRLLAEGVLSNHILYIPKDPDDNRLLICPQATTLSEVVTGCAGGVEYTEDSEDIFVMTYLDGNQYWIYASEVYTGGMSYRVALEDTGDPAALFSVFGLGMLVQVPVVLKKKVIG